MGYYNIFKYFISRLFSFLRSITGKLFVIFVLLFFVLILFTCVDNGVFAVSPSGSGQYGNYIGFSAHDIELLDGVISQYKGNYDSFIARYYYSDVPPDRRISISFYNYDTNGRLYVTPTGPTFNYLINSEYSVNNSVNYVVFNYYDFSLVSSDYRQNVYFGIRDFGTGNSTSSDNVFYTNRIVYTSNSFVTQFFDGGNNSIASVDPYITNSDSSISNWSFDYLTINSGDVGYVYYDELLQQSSYADLNLKYTYDGITYTQSIPSGYLVDWSDENFTLEIPRTWLLFNVNIQNGKTIDFYLEVKKQNVSDNIYFLGSYTLSLTTAEQEQIQQDNDKALQGQILESQQQTNNKLDSLDNTINDSSIEDITSDSLPSDSTTDITADGVNGIFTSIYNAFCVGNAQDIVFPIPFTDKSITLSANYILDALTTSGATFIITIIQAFWWYIISRFIIKDVMNKINKIKSGNIEDIETTNIRGDML